MENGLINYGYVTDKIAENNPKYFTMKIAAQRINKKGFGRTKLYELMRKKGFINEDNSVVEKYQREGYFIHEQKLVYNGYSNICIYQTLVSAKGLELLLQSVE